MNFELRNFGKIYEADVKLDGITVICGNNNTGKSTVGKALFSFYNSLYEYKSRISANKLSEILVFIAEKDGFPVKINNETIALYKKYLRKKLETTKVLNFILSNENKFSVEEVKKFIEVNFNIQTSEDELEVLVNNLNLPEKDILNELVFRYFDNVMNGQVKRLKSANGRCTIKAEIKSKTHELKFTNQKCNCDIKDPIAHKAYYINSPYVLDYLNNDLLDISTLSILERNVIEAIKQAKTELNADSTSKILDAVSNKNDLEEIEKVLKKAYKGETKIDNGLYVYEDENGIQFDFRNISAGLKAFALIERLLKGGVLKKKDVLILDEPEIHLHSEWQIYYAELIVALQKKFDLTILLVTHSFQFLESLNFFMKTYGISDRGNYYIPEETKNGCDMKHSENNLNEMKKSLKSGMYTLADMQLGDLDNGDFDEEDNE
ncbi:MAG: ATP-binding protein [Ruminococcus sp.]|nr:ATP-binding protein [Ruminococcus sp.]